MKEQGKKIAEYAAGFFDPMGGGRTYKESVSADRDEYERDYARIIHSGAFRVLQYKTQVFANHQGDYFRTRLTHSLEVAQLAGAAARALHLRDSLAATLAVAHDLGHAPFGHLGQDVLNEKMKDFGGFEHNWQALRIVDELESPYLGFKGLNLLFDTREGILKHCSRNNAKHLGKVGERFLSDVTDTNRYQSASLEAQVTDVCDAIAYNHADLEDAVLMKVLSVGQAREGLPLFDQKAREVEKEYGPIKQGQELRFTQAVCNLMIKEALGDLIVNTRKNIEQAAPSSVEHVRVLPKLAKLSDAFATQYHYPMKKFLKQNVYEHGEVAIYRNQQQEVLGMIFDTVKANPKKYLEGGISKDGRTVERQVCDFVANLTDRRAIELFHSIRQSYSYGNSKTRKAGM